MTIRENGNDDQGESNRRDLTARPNLLTVEVLSLTATQKTTGSIRNG